MKSNNSPSLKRHSLKSAKEAVLKIDFDTPQPAAQSYIDLMGSLLQYPLPLGDALPVLEDMRKPLDKVLHGLREVSSNSRTPMLQTAAQAFELNARCLRLMADLYAKTTEQMGDDMGLPSNYLRSSTLLQRHLFYLAALASAYYRARRELPAGLWLEAHATYGKASMLGLAMTTVDDALDIIHPTSNCLTVYVRMMLVDIANPYSQRLSDIDYTERWAAQWCSLTHIENYIHGKHSPSFLIDSTHDSSLVATKEYKKVPKDARVINTSKLDLEIRSALTKLQSGVSPSVLGLGDDSIEFTKQLLSRVAFPWTQFIIARRFRRYNASGPVEVALGFKNIYSLLGDNKFACGEDKNNKAPENAPATERWSLANYSAQGFLIRRSAPGLQLMHGQLMAIKTEDSENILLAQVSWLMQAQNEDILAGIQVLPGVPEVVQIVDSTPENTGSAAPFRAFLLPSLSSIDEDASLVIPLRRFDSERRYHLSNEDSQWRIRFTAIKGSGHDFERTGFVMC